MKKKNNKKLDTVWYKNKGRDSLALGTQPTATVLPHHFFPGSILHSLVSGFYAFILRSIDDHTDDDNIITLLFSKTLAN